jgi:predicted PurR-regulated permease PerM
MRHESALERSHRSLPPPWDRIFSLGTRFLVWTLLFGILYILRPFFLLIFLTFVFAYIQAHGVDGLAHRIKNRPMRVTIVGLVFLGTLLATGFSLLPQVREQADQFIEKKDLYVHQADSELKKFLNQWPSVYDSLLKRSEALSDEEEAAAVQPPRSNSSTGSRPPVRPPAITPVRPPEGQDPAAATTNPRELHAIRDLLNKVTKSVAENPIEITQQVLGFASSFLLSLLFSFLIVLDLPKITRGVRGLANTRIGFIYNEVADNIAGFGRVLGRALEAQLLIAICNTILTAIGIWMLGLPNLLVLSTIVFICSFIPVAGTFISSTPICLLALQSGGVTSMLLAIGLITAIHALETYVLNPQIYGHHMHMNPVLVLIVLTIGGKLFGVWGLLLGIPIVNYVFRHAIRRPEERPAEV